MAREMLRHPEMGMKPVGFLDDAPRKGSYRIMGIPVLGTVAELDQVIQTVDIDEVVIAIPSAQGRTVREVVEKINANKTACQLQDHAGYLRAFKRFGRHQEDARG